eukprot:4041912-Lingulodinium_polyedra.AAC.1
MPQTKHPLSCRRVCPQGHRPLDSRYACHDVSKIQRTSWHARPDSTEAERASTARNRGTHATTQRQLSARAWRAPSANQARNAWRKRGATHPGNIKRERDLTPPK